MRRRDEVDDLDLAHRLVDAAVEISMSWFGRDPAIEDKPDGTKVTVADREVEEELRRILNSERPDDGVIGEEFPATHAGGSDREWIIDPIDGTNSFIAGGPLWGTLLALRVQGELRLGVVSQPIAERRTWAQRGFGAHRRHKGVLERLHVSTVDSLHHARSTPVPSDAPTELRPRLESLWRSVSVHDVPTEVTELDHPGLLVASGRSDFAITFGHLWDIAPIEVIVVEAGGHCGNLDGAKRGGTGTLFSNGIVHTEVLEGLGFSG